MELGIKNMVEQRHVLDLKQQLFLTALNLPALELSVFIKEQTEQNPFLDYEMPRFHLPILYDVPDTTFYMDSLFRQLKLSSYPEEIIEAGGYIIENIESDGYLRVSLAEISDEKKTPLRIMEKALEAVHSLEPAGVGARDLRECFLLQAKRCCSQNVLLHVVIEKHWDRLLKKDYAGISIKTGFSSSELRKALSYRHRFVINPLSCTEEKKVKRIFTEGKISREKGSFKVTMDDKVLAYLSINPMLEKIERKDFLTDAERKFVERGLNRARMVIKIVEERKAFLTRVFQTVVDLQADFFKGGALVPLREQDIAEKERVSVSTVSRAVKGKYLDTPAGRPVCMKELFSTRTAGNFSRHFISESIKEVMACEKSPMSDRQIVEKLSGFGIRISVRTVNKYRNREGILNSYLR